MKLLIISKKRITDSVKADINLIDVETKEVKNVGKEVIALAKALNVELWGRFDSVYGTKYGGFEDACKKLFHKEWNEVYDWAFEKISKTKREYIISKNVLQEIVKADYIFIN